MSVVRYCSACGAEGVGLATVMDPFADSTWLVCRDCLGPLYEKQMAVIRRKLGASR